MNNIQLTIVVIGLVAIARRIFPKIDGAFVAVAAVTLAGVASIVAAPSEIAIDLSRGLVTGLTAFGAMCAVRYATRRLEIAEAVVRFEHAPEAEPAHGHGGHHAH
ncbi:MAG: hypothetical protein ACHREM_32170, partial [Polyangiales bacterium]